VGGRDWKGTARAVRALPVVRAVVDSQPYRTWRLRRLEGPESRFTAARPDCAFPEHWTSTDSDSAELEVTELVVAFVRALQPDFVVETGTALGQTALRIGQALERNGHGRLVSLEIDPGRIARARRRVRGLPVDVIACSSVEYEPPELVDFAWLDSLPELRIAEFRRFWPKMHSGTIVGFHDTGPTHALRPEIDVLEAERLLAPIHLSTPRGVTFAQALGRPMKHGG
jgi:hypothetical protein